MNVSIPVRLPAAGLAADARFIKKLKKNWRNEIYDENNWVLWKSFLFDQMP